MDAIAGIAKRASSIQSRKEFIIKAHWIDLVKFGDSMTNSIS
jgi:hypothetical protein